MNKLDLKKTHKELYGGKVGQNTIVTVPKFKFLMVDGQGDPNSAPEYIDAIQTLYPVAYRTKFFCKAELGKDFAVMPLEGLWWADDMENFAADKSKWSWTMMIMQPDFVTADIIDEVVAEVRDKKNPASIGKIRLEEYEEGSAAQVMYVGSYSDEGPTIENLHEFIAENGGVFDGHDQKHHEIYLGDPRRTDPAKLKTIIRQPFRN